MYIESRKNSSIIFLKFKSKLFIQWTYREFVGNFKKIRLSNLTTTSLSTFFFLFQINSSLEIISRHDLRDLIQPILDFAICSYHPRRPQAPSFSLSLSLHAMRRLSAKTRQEDEALIIRSRRSFHRDGRTGRDGVRNHIFQVMPVNAANKGSGEESVYRGPINGVHVERPWQAADRRWK